MDDCDGIWSLSRESRGEASVQIQAAKANYAETKWTKQGSQMFNDFDCYRFFRSTNSNAGTGIDTSDSQPMQFAANKFPQKKAQMLTRKLIYLGRDCHYIGGLGSYFP